MENLNLSMAKNEILSEFSAEINKKNKLMRKAVINYLKQASKVVISQDEKNVIIDIYSDIFGNDKFKYKKTKNYSFSEIEFNSDELCELIKKIKK